MKKFFSTNSLKAVIALFIIGAFSDGLSAQAYRYFLSQTQGSTSSLYEVNVDGANANLSLVTTVNYSTHIAFNEVSKSIFFVNTNNANYQSYDIASSTFSAVNVIGSSGSFVATAFEDGLNLTIGNANNNKLYTIPADFFSSALTEVMDAPISGGDVVYSDGELYLATRAGNRLMKKVGSAFVQIASIPSSVTGMARMADGKLILSFFNSTTFKVYNPDGTLHATLNARLAGEPYTQFNGDMASGSFVVPCHAETLISFDQKKRNDGTTINIERSNPLKALGAPQMSDATVPESEVNFASLGFGGSITVGFSSPIKNGDGNDLKVFETTYAPSTGNCARYPETIRAFASQDGCNWVYLGSGCQDTEFDLGPLAWAQYVKLIDITNPSGGVFAESTGDGYDVDGIVCLNGFEEDPNPTMLVFGSAQEVISFDQGTRKDLSPVALSRSDVSKALGTPEMTDAVNFVSLGFGGVIVLKFDYVIFDGEGEEIQIVETSFGNPACNSYPEKVSVEGSLDGINWILLTDDDMCLDGMIDINNAGVIQYVRIMDRSAATNFNNSGDAYDLDGVVVLTSCDEDAELIRFADDVNTPDEIATAAAYPNPFKESVMVEITTGDQDNNATIEVTNYMGQLISRESINVASSSSVRHTIAADGFNKGVYFITIITNSSKETIKVIKN